MRSDRTAQPLADINMVPFIDVLLVLLVIVLITLPMVTQPIPITLPRTDRVAGAAASTQPAQPILHLALDAEQQLYWDGVPIAAADVSARLAQTANTHPVRKVHVHAARTTPYEAVAQLMAQLAQAGLGDIGLVTEQSVQPPSKPLSQPKDLP